MTTNRWQRVRYHETIPEKGEHTTMPDMNELYEHGPDTIDDSQELLCSPLILMSEAVYQNIMDALTSVPPEAAGALLGPRDHHAVTHFLFDDAGKASPGSFTLGHRRLNEELKKYLDCDIDCKGIVHSHPAGCVNPSRGDLAYVQRSFANPKNHSLERFLLPIVVAGRMYPYVITRDDPRAPQSAVLLLF